jgi:protein-S-isoprenylcysteine O-methyltransferase Ste14
VNYVPYVAGLAGAMALFDVTVAVWALSELGQTLRHRDEATQRDRGSRLVIVLAFGGAFVLAALARKVTVTAIPANAVTFGIGLAVVWAGVGLRWWSFLALGRYFTIEVMTSPDQPVITTGPYRFVRHPSYAGLLLVFAGIGITEGNWLSLAAMIVLPLLGLLNRIHVEEAALSGTLGAAYQSYAASRKRLIPYVW